MRALGVVDGDFVSQPSVRSVRALSGLNFFLADVRDGLGPFLGVFLIGRGWGADTIGYVMTIGGIAGMLATTPFGALADATRAKRLMVAVCAVLVVVASLAILFVQTVPVVAASQLATGIARAAIGPAIAGLTLGLVGQAGLAHQLGRNEAWNHAGNAIAAALSSLLGYVYGLPAVFVLMSVLAVASIVAHLLIDPADIDHATARGLDPGSGTAGAQPASFRALLDNRRLLVLAGALMMFHLGNAAMLPLLGQRVAASGSVDPAAYTAATVIIAQLTMIPLALLAARTARAHGYFVVLLAALIPVQMLDGVGAGLMGVAVPGLVARIMRGSGRVNASLGAVMTVQGIGASLSASIGGYVAATYGFGAAFLALGALAIPALLLWVAFGKHFRIETASAS